jgi:hypothetical protein
MGTLHTTMNVLGMKMPGQHAHVGAQRPLSTSITAEAGAKHPHTHGETGQWTRSCAPSQEQEISMNGCRDLTFIKQPAHHTNPPPPKKKENAFPPQGLPFPTFSFAFLFSLDLPFLFLSPVNVYCR